MFTGEVRGKRPKETPGGALRNSSAGRSNPLDVTSPKPEVAFTADGAPNRRLYGNSPIRVFSDTPVGMAVDKQRQLDRGCATARARECREPEMLALPDEIERPRPWPCRKILQMTNAVGSRGGRKGSEKPPPKTTQPVHAASSVSLIWGRSSKGFISPRPTYFRRNLQASPSRPLSTAPKCNPTVCQAYSAFGLSR